MLDMATIAGVMGDMQRPKPAVISMGRSISTESTFKDAAILGARLAKAKNEALPEPIMNEEATMIKLIIKTIVLKPKPAD